MEDESDMVKEVECVQDVQLRQGGYFGLHGDDGVGRSGGVGESRGSDVFRSLFFVGGGGGMFESGFLIVRR